VSSEIGVGFASRDVTPPLGTPMAGYAARSGPAAAVHDPLYARALAFDDGNRRVVMIALDVLGITADLTAAVREHLLVRCGLPPEHVAVAATHTHGGPAVLPDAFLGDAAPATLAAITAGAVEAAQEALASIAPATLVYAKGCEATVGQNRRVAGGPVDPDVPVVAAFREARPVALLTSYACHPVVLAADNRAFTRDYPGALLDALESRWPGCFAMFLVGCCGQINDGHRAETSLTDAPAPGRDFATATKLGQRLAQAAQDALAGAVPGRLAGAPIRVGRRFVDLPFGPLTALHADPGWRAELASHPPPTPARRAVLAALLSWAERFPRAQAGSHRVEIGCWRLGDLAIAWFPGEVFVEHGLELKAADATGTLLTIANANAAPGYVPHHSAYAQGGYEVVEAYRYYGFPAPFLPAAGERLAAAMDALVREVRV
jgi:neutral ceramidase